MDIIAMARYNVWANHQFTNWVQEDLLEEIDREIPNSFNSILKTMRHIWFAEDVWLKRIMGKELNLELLQVTELEIISGGLKISSSKLHEIASNTTVEDLETAISYYNSKGTEFQSRLIDILMHVFNHGTYHRGQIVTMARAIGVEKIPQTDYIHYIRAQNV